MSGEAGARLAIICVDDEEVVLVSLKRQLRKLFGSAFLYETAQSADEGWEILEELHEDGHEVLLIVSDWLMPRVKGDEFLVSVHARFPQIAKVLLTGQADAAGIERARQGANLLACLHKPWSSDDLEQLLKNAQRRA